MTKAHVTSPDNLGQGSLPVLFQINRSAVNTKEGAFPRSSYGITQFLGMAYLYPQCQPRLFTSLIQSLGAFSLATG